ncbi:MAG: rRNA maturation RNase YbeY [Bacteroidota bacterium]
MVISCNHPYLRFPRAETIKTVRNVLEGENREMAGMGVVFTNNVHMRRINRQYLQHDYNTDVIAFDLSDKSTTESELYINLDRARSQAREFNVSFSEEIRRLLIHGTLHLLGYRDKKNTDRKTMKLREDRYLALLTKGKGS